MRLAAIILGALAATFGVGPAGAQELVADLSNHLVAISTGFSGTDVLLFGAQEGTGDVVVVVRGPQSEVAVRRKGRVAGIWINTRSLVFTGVPSYYAVASTAPIETVVPPAVRARQQIGFDNLRLGLEEDAPADEVAEFRRALIRAKQKTGVWANEVGRVTRLGNTLFRTNVHFPANVPVGTYLVEVMLLIVGKVGFDADVYDFAHRQSALYGLVAIVVALLIGWVPHLVFRRN
jgi:uncharacterized protein (TIGR02186 family)